MSRLPNWYSHFERPDSSYPEYSKVFGDDMELDDYDIDEIVDEYVGANTDEAVKTYARMGPPDEGYMREVRAKWSR